MPGPIKPNEVAKKKTESLPDEVFQAFNECIALHWDGSRSNFIQDEVVARICELLKIDRHEVFKKHYLDVEDAYRAAGWKVEYDKPAYCET